MKRLFGHRSNLLTGRQLQAARALAGITQQQLADAARLHVNSIRYMERKGRITNTLSTVEAVAKALEGFGVELVASPAPGVMMRNVA